LKNKKVLVTSAIIAVVVVAALALLFNSGLTGFAVTDPDYESVMPRDLRQGAPTIELPAEFYQELYNSEGFVEVTCPDGRQGIEILMAHPFKDPCYVSE